MFFKQNTIDSIVSDIQSKIDALIALAGKHEEKASNHIEKIDFVKADAMEATRKLQEKIAEVNTATDVSVNSLTTAAESEKASAERARQLASNFTKLISTKE